MKGASNSHVEGGDTSVGIAYVGVNYQRALVSCRVVVSCPAVNEW
jgi:hypothetical protein